jgi:hypothetical protein
MSFIANMRDKAVEAAVRQMIQRVTTAIKDLKNLKIDPQERTFSLNLELAGETEPLAVTGSYQLVENDGKTRFMPANIRTSKEWITILAAELLKGRSFEVPGMAKNFL